MAKFRYLTPLILGLACTSDKGITVHNNTPEVTISSPVDGEQVIEGTSVSIQGQVNDDNDLGLLEIVWRVDGQVVCSESQPDTNGNLQCSTTFESGGGEVQLSATDADGAQGSAVINLDVIPNETPTAEIISPSEDGVYKEGDQIEFRAILSDAEDSPTELTASWSSSLGDDLSNLGTEPDSNGEIFDFATLSEGEHVIRLEVEDSNGDSDMFPVIITVGPANEAPAISSVILSPSEVYTNDIITATVSATDQENDTLSYSFDWYVDDGSGANLAITNQATIPEDTLDGAQYFDKNDQVYVEVTVSDTYDSDDQTSTPIAVLNTPPSVTSVTISPQDPIAGIDDLVCTNQTADDDSDSVITSYIWEVDGVMSSYADTNVPSADIVQGEVWTCIVTPDDGDDIGATGSASITIGANIPEAVGTTNCASAGSSLDGSGYQITSCLAETSIVGSVTTDPSSYTWQPGSIFIFSPE